MVRPTGESGVVAALVDDHVRSLQPGHLTDVISTDKHTVKPWFDGKLDFAPPVKDLAAQGYPLVGGRLDYLGGRPVAALAYQHGKHPINLYVWPERGGADAPADTTRDGYNVLHWSADGMALWAVSDLERDELQEFERDWQKGP
jgi:anti-sigma factor RsiW